jgi:Amidohydrolase
MKWMHGFYPEHPIPRDVTLEQCIAYYDTIAVDYIFNLVYPIRDDETEVVNRFNLELQQRYPWIVPFGGLHVADPDKGAIVERCLGEYGFLGFKFHPFIQAFDPLDPRMMPAYERLAAWKRPVVFHTGYEEFYERIVERHANVWLEMTNVFSSFWDRRYVLKEYDTEKRLLLEGIGPHSERIMFGTDHPAGSGTLEEIYRTMDARLSRRHRRQTSPDLACRASDPATELRGPEADGRRHVRRDERTEPHGQTDGELVERHVDEAAENRDALFEPDDGDGVRHGPRVGPGRNANDSEARDRAVARERHRLPLVGVAGRAELFRRHRQLAARAAADGGELSGARLLEEDARGDGRLSHDRRGSRGRSRCFRRACG